MQKLRKTTTSYEALFIERYGRMLDWSLRLTRQDRDEAEDLLHDAFIQFTLGRPDLDMIENLDGYLYVMLRNMRLSQVRRASRGPVALHSLVDYDSAELSLRAADARNQIQVQDELGKICHFACIRKETSKAGSVLILRFFHGYYPAEIARVMRSPRRAVDDWLRAARREVKTYLDNPRRLNFIGEKTAVQPVCIGFDISTVNFLFELRRAIYRSRRGECLTGMRLRKLYGSEDSGPLDCAILAHIVSCPRCLEKVNAFLGLSPLSDRYPTDMLGPDPGSEGGSGGDFPKAGAPGAMFKKALLDAKDAFEHRPNELRISVNGFILGSQKINSDLNEHALTVNLDENIGFVEVLSEQGVRLLFLNVTPPPDGPVEQSARVMLSEDRYLELRLDFSDRWPSLQSLYHDPSLKPVHQAQTNLTEEEEVIPSQSNQAPFDALYQPFKTGPSDRASALTRWLRPGFVTAVLAVLVVISVLLVKMRVTPVSAAELLDRASASEDIYAARPDFVTHRWFELEERNLAGSGSVVRRKVEVWSNAAKGVSARRLYDEGGKLIAGEWTDADGLRTVFRQGAASQTRVAPELKERIENADIWLLEPSAKMFTKLIPQIEAAVVEERSGRYFIKYRNDKIIPVGVLLSATLTLDKNTLHPFEQVLTARFPDGDREYRFRESSHKRFPVETVSPKVFQPDEGLLSKSAMREQPLFMRDEAAPPGAVTIMPAGIASKAVEMEAMYQLHRIGACMREQPALTRNPTGRLIIQAIAQTEKRKEEILQSLGSIINNAPVEVEVKTVSEAIQSQMHIPSGVARRVQIAKGKIPVHEELYNHFSNESGQGESDDRVEEKIRRFATGAMNRSRRVLLQAWALRHLAKQFSSGEMESLGPEMQVLWRAMVREHARQFRQEIRAMRMELQGVFAYSSSGDESKKRVETAGIMEADQSIELIFKAALSQEETARNAFAVSVGGEASKAIMGEPFRQSLIRAESLAEGLESMN